MAVKNVKTLSEMVVPVKRGSAEMEALLYTGYGMTVKEAEQVLEERKVNPMTHPYERAEQAKALLAAYHAKDLNPSSVREGWKRNRQ